MRRLILYLSILILVVISATGYYLYTQTTETKEKYESEKDISEETFEEIGTTRKEENKEYVDAYVVPKILYWGSRGQDVKDVQWKLLQWDYYNGAVDGIYGTQTYTAVREFQRKNGLTVDGVVGTQTAAALGLYFGTTGGGAEKKGTSTAGVSRNDDIYLLARLIHGEARGEPYIGKVAVGAVVLNRVDHPSFPKTMAEVIYKPLAFTAVADGQIDIKPDAESLKAARDAMNGWDPTYGCKYYWNPATATSKWIWSREVVIKLGKHWFGN